MPFSARPGPVSRRDGRGERRRGDKPRIRPTFLFFSLGSFTSSFWCWCFCTHFDGGAVRLLTGSQPVTGHPSACCWQVHQCYRDELTSVALGDPLGGLLMGSATAISTATTPPHCCRKDRDMEVPRNPPQKLPMASIPTPRHGRSRLAAGSQSRRGRGPSWSKHVRRRH